MFGVDAKLDYIDNEIYIIYVYDQNRIKADRVHHKKTLFNENAVFKLMNFTYFKNR